MILINELMPAGVPTPEAADFLRASGIFDEVFYRQQAGIPPDHDAALHYLQEGWRQGLEPNGSFSSRFLSPFYATVGYDGAAALSWADLSTIGLSRLPTNEAEAESMASPIRDIPLFDPAYYARRLPAGLDPALHYAILGERMGWRPSEGFDPSFYCENYPDIAGFPSLLHHYWSDGRREGRSGVAAADRLIFPDLPKDDKRPVVLVVSHEASRTGAPILGWNIIKHLAQDYQVVSLLMNGGPLEEDFAAISAVQVGPMMRTEWREAQARRMAERLVSQYRPLYAITNSIETHIMVPSLDLLGVPSVSLVHEFISYTHDAISRIPDIYNWASHVIFPAKIVAQSSYDHFYLLDERTGISIQPQGQAELPPGRPVDSQEKAPQQSKLSAQVRPEGDDDTFVVLGVGTVETRKGVDLFISTAASLQRMNPALKFRFVWIGDKPHHEARYLSFLMDQIARSNLADKVVMLDPVADLEPAYKATDAFFMCSRLDPQPNVGIDAVTRGIPTICFESASGTSEVLAADAATKHLVAPYLDTHAAACLINDLARSRDDLPRLRREMARVGSNAFNMKRYVAAIDAHGRAAADPQHAADLKRLVDAGVIDRDLVQPPGTPILDDVQVVRYAMRQWSLWNVIHEPRATSPLRRPCAGFHSQAYAQAHPEVMHPCARDPVAHWLEQGRPEGHWSHPVYSPLHPPPGSDAASSLRIALHGHFHYVDMAGDLAWRLSRNQSACDLFLTTGSEESVRVLQQAFGKHRGQIDIRLVPNRGRDIGPFITALRDDIRTGGYDIFGHVHGKKTVTVSGNVGEAWRNFLWENLIGGQYPMLDLAAAAFARNRRLGLLMADDPHLVSWDKNRGLAEELAQRMSIPLPLKDFFDFPVGTMFWARPAALEPLLALGLTWTDYPEEPVPIDGTVLHALERMIPFVVQHADHTIAGVRVPGTNW